MNTFKALMERVRMHNSMIPKKKTFDDEFVAKSEIPNLLEMLDSQDYKKNESAAERVIYLMRSGENMRPLFSLMLKLVNTNNMSLKKLIYLYLINYSSQEPEQAIMAVNMFIKDSQNPNPIVRALAVRTMCRIRIQSVAENMVIPLKKTLEDTDPYVRKTSALGVAKLYDIIPDIVESSGLFQNLINLLNDDNPMVVANSIAGICEINDKRKERILDFNEKVVLSILSALDDCSSWCQIMILDALAKYRPESSDHAASLNDRLSSFLNNSNPAVVISAFKCIYNSLDYDYRGPPYVLSLIIPPIITLLNISEPEIQYVVLRTLSLFVKKYPHALSNQISSFYCKYNEKPFIKMEKLNIIMSLCTKKYAKLVLGEMIQYCNSVDVCFVKSAIQCIGKIALKYEGTTPDCVEALLKLTESKADYSNEETIIVLCDVFRKYPGEYENIIPIVCQNIGHLKAPAARAAIIWILGEYCKEIENIDVLIDQFLDNFQDEQTIVQSQILNTIVKIFIEYPDKVQDQLQFVLNESSKDTISPDIQDQASLYYKLLSQDISMAKEILLFPKDSIQYNTFQFEDSVLNELISNAGHLAGVLYELPSSFIVKPLFFKNEEQDKKWYQLKPDDGADFLDMFMAIFENKFYLKLVNRCSLPISELAFAINLNVIGLEIEDEYGFPNSLEEDESCEVSFDFTLNPEHLESHEKTSLEIALRTNYGTVFAYGRIPIEITFTSEGKISQEKFTDLYNTLQNEFSFKIYKSLIADDNLLNSRKVYVIGKNNEKTFVSFVSSSLGSFVGELVQDGEVIYVSGYTDNPLFSQLIEKNGIFIFAE